MLEGIGVANVRRKKKVRNEKKIVQTVKQTIAFK